MKKKTSARSGARRSNAPAEIPGQPTPKRKGSLRIADIPPQILADLNAGRIESASLAEGLAVNFAILMRSVVPGIGDDGLDRLREEKRFTRRLGVAGELLQRHGGLKLAQRLVSHPSDMVRCWSAYAISWAPGLKLSERLVQIRMLADDSHFGVRECAWMAMRSHIAEDILKAIRLLRPWVGESSPNLRRFAVESTRPRGVWCEHISELKASPDHGLPLLDPLRADPTKYVQDSVANWLNDASKSKPSWVSALCKRWARESPVPQTRRICGRALRSIGFLAKSSTKRIASDGATRRSRA